MSDQDRTFVNLLQITLQTIINQIFDYLCSNEVFLKYDSKMFL